MTTQKFLLVLSALFYFAFAKAQLTGTIIDSQGLPVPFASIYVKDSYTGTSTNSTGNYMLELKAAGSYEIVFQSLGYTTITKTISYPETQILDITLKEEVATLTTVVIDSDENPALEVIRKAIENREANRLKSSSYKANFYSRGLWRMEDVPEKFLGQEIGDLDGSLDSLTRSGIIYLSETVSRIAYQAPNDFKETIVASKVSGDDNGFSINSAEAADFNFYNNNIDLNNQIISPIADYAFNYYDYKLLGTINDNNGFLINKIQVISKRPKDNTFTGIIYIVEDQWTISGLELTTLGENINVPAIESLTFNQDFTYEPATQDWIKRSQSIDFSFGFLGFKGNGRFIASYTDYEFDVAFDDKYFGAEVLSFEAGSNKKTLDYWTDKRSVPLTVEEDKEYIKKDSITAIRENPVYKDSVDQVRNKFRPFDILSGYTYRNSNKRYRIGYNGVTGIDNFKGFNTVQGYVVGTGVFFSKGYDEDYNKSLSVTGNVEYGIDDDRLRYNGRVSYRFNRIKRNRISVYAGTRIRQFTNSISTLENTISTLFFERNFAKFYEVDYAGAAYSQELINGVFFNINASYEKRQPLFNTTDQTFFDNSGVSYTSNNPLIPATGAPAIITEHNIFKTNVNLTIRPGQKYQSYPDQKINIRSEKYPTINLQYESGLGSDNSDNDFHQFRASVYQGFDLGNLGRSNYWVNGGTFIDGDNISFVDHQHFNGNQLRYKLRALNTYGFGLLPYYNYSTNESYAQVHLQHDFKGYILGKIPGINKLNYDLIIGSKALMTERKPYYEVSAGIDNIGIGKYRPLRVDYVHSITSGRSYGAFIIGLDLGF